MGIHDFASLTFLIRHKQYITPDMLIFYDVDLSQADFDAIDFDNVDFNTEQFRDKIYNIKAVYEPTGTRRQWLMIEAILKN